MAQHEQQGNGETGTEVEDRMIVDDAVAAALEIVSELNPQDVAPATTLTLSADRTKAPLPFQARLRCSAS
jgi:hypothetical protein